MAFDVGAIFATLELDKKQWEQSIAAVAKDQEKLTAAVGKTEVPLSNLNRILKEYGIKTAADAAARTKQLSADLETLSQAYKSGQISLGSYQQASKQIDTELKKLVGDMDATKQSAQGSSSTMKDMAGAFILAQAAIATVSRVTQQLTGFMTDCIQGAMGAEKSENSLRLSLAASGRTVAGNLTHYMAYARELHNTTLFTHEQAEAAQALLVSLTSLDQKGLDEATRGAVGLATVFGMDLLNATEAVGRGYEGNYMFLNRMIPQVRLAKTEEEKHAAMVKALAGFYQQAAGQVDTFSGKLIQSKKAWDEIKESLGKVITQDKNINIVLNEGRIVLEHYEQTTERGTGIIGLYKRAVEGLSTAFRLSPIGTELEFQALKAKAQAEAFQKSENVMSVFADVLKLASPYLKMLGLDLDKIVGIFNSFAPKVNETGDNVKTLAQKAAELGQQIGALTRTELETKLGLINKMLKEFPGELTVEEYRKLVEQQAKYKEQLAGVNPFIAKQKETLRALKISVSDLTAAYKAGAIELPEYGKKFRELFTNMPSMELTLDIFFKGLDKKFDQTTIDMGDSWSQFVTDMNVDFAKAAEKDLPGHLQGLDKLFDKTTGQILDIWNEMNQQIVADFIRSMGAMITGQQSLVDGFHSLVNSIVNLWLNAMVSVAQIGMKARDSIGKIFSSMVSTATSGILGIIGTAITVASFVVSVIGSLFKKTKAITQDQIKEITDMVGRTKATMYLTMDTKQAEKAIAKLQNELAMIVNGLGGLLSSTFGGEVSSGTLEAIGKDMQHGMEGYIAINKHLADIIKDVGVNQGNLNIFWQKSIDIINEMKSGAMDAQDGIKALGESFNLLVEGARKLGAEGGQGMVDFIKKLRAAGMEVPEVTAYIISELNKIPEALATIVNNLYMPTTSLSDMEAALKKLEDQLSKTKSGTKEWQDLNNQIKVTQKGILDLQSHLPSTAKGLDNMGKIAVASFQAMLANGVSFLDALKAMDAPLQGMLDRYKALGLAVPDFLKPLLDMEKLSKQFPAVFSNMSAGLQILNSLRNSAYLTQSTFDALVSTVEDFAHTILGTAGNLNTFLKSAKLNQTQIQALLPVISQFVGAAAIFGLAVPSWMKTFVTKNLGVDWEKFKSAAAAQASAGITTVERLDSIIAQNDALNTKTLIRHDYLFGLLADRIGQHLKDLGDRLIGKVPSAQSGAYVARDTLAFVHHGERILSASEVNGSGGEPSGSGGGNQSIINHIYVTLDGQVIAEKTQKIVAKRARLGRFNIPSRAVIG